MIFFTDKQNHVFTNKWKSSKCISHVHSTDTNIVRIFEINNKIQKRFHNPVKHLRWSVLRAKRSILDV